MHRPPAGGPVADRRRRSTIEVSGPITTSTLWSADTVRVVGALTIENGVTLTVAPGVRVLFDGHFGISVQGTIRAVGTADSPIELASAHPEEFVIDSTTAGSWSGIRFEYTSSLNDSSHLEYCIIRNCKAAGDSSRGAALAAIGFSKLRVANCHFTRNVADLGAVLYCANFAAPTLAGCVITDNHAFVSGSAVYSVDAYPRLVNDTVIDNPAKNPEIYDPAAAVHNHISKPRTINCIIRENSTSYYFGGQIFRSKGYYTIHSNIEGGHDGAGNIDADPLFVGLGEHPFALQETSPCVDAGTLDMPPSSLLAHDIAGHPRVQLDAIDMGAYEWQPITPVSSPPAAASARFLVAAPNPFRALTALTFPATGAEQVRVAVYDVRGRCVNAALHAVAGASSYSVIWDGREEDGSRLSPGSYFVRVSGEGWVRTVKTVLLH